jgi:hypothetical protein
VKNLDQIKERYFREPFNSRLGHLASDLLRVSNFVDNPKNRAVVTDIIEESEFFIEWSAPTAPSPIQQFLAEIQRKLALWHRHFMIQAEDPAEREELKQRSKEWSARLLEFSGLLAD